MVELTPGGRAFVDSVRPREKPDATET